MKFGLEDRHWQIVEQLVIQPLKNLNCKVWIFGSRANGKFKRFSDLDILYQSNEADLNLNKYLIEINEQIENSNLPIKVDIVCDKDLAESYREGVMHDRILM